MRINNKIKGLVMVSIALPTFWVSGQEQNIGINTENPSATLHIKGKGLDGDTKAFEVSNGSDNKTRKILFTALDDGRIGLGVENPQAFLHLNSDGVSPAIELERDYQGVGLTGRSKNMLPINYSNEYNARTSYGYIGDGSIYRRMQLVSYAGDNVLRSESKYRDGDYTEVVNYQAGSEFKMNIRNNNQIHYSEVKNGVLKIAPYDSTSEIDGSNSLIIEGAMVLGDGGYNPSLIPSPVPADGTMIFYQGNASEGSFYVWSRGQWRKLDND